MQSFPSYYPRAWVIVSFPPPLWRKKKDEKKQALDQLTRYQKSPTVYRLRAPIIAFNSICLIIGFALLGFAKQDPVRYIGVFLATGAYISNWAALNSYQANNITG